MSSMSILQADSINAEIIADIVVTAIFKTAPVKTDVVFPVKIISSSLSMKLSSLRVTIDE